MPSFFGLVVILISVIVIITGGGGRVLPKTAYDETP